MVFLVYVDHILEQFILLIMNSITYWIMKLLRGKQYVLLGDLNISLLRDFREVEMPSNSMSSKHLFPLITKSTRFSPNNVSVATLLDHKWYNVPSNYLSVFITHDLTDNLPTLLRVPFEVFRTDDSKIKVSFRCKND